MADKQYFLHTISSLSWDDYTMVKGGMQLAPLADWEH